MDKDERIAALEKELEEANKGYEAASLEITMTGLDVGRALTGARLLYSTDIGLRVEALRERAEKAEQALALQGEPVAWLYKCTTPRISPVLMDSKQDWADSGTGLWTETPLYAAPISGERVREACAKACKGIPVPDQRPSDWYLGFGIAVEMCIEAIRALPLAAIQGEQE